MSSKSIYSKSIHYIQIANAKHKNFYNYNKFIYDGYHKKSIIICPIHGEFLQRVSDHLSGKGCGRCAILRTHQRKPKSNHKFIIDAKAIHGDKYDYSNVVYKTARTKVEIICNIHGKFYQIPNSHLSGAGCPSCSHRISKPCEEWISSLNIESLIREYAFPENRHKHADAYDPITNTVYQFHGSYWHSDPRVYNSDDIHDIKKIPHSENYMLSMQSDEQIINWGYNLIIMWEYDWNSQ